MIVPPRGQIGPITPQQRGAILAGSLVSGHYESAVDRESAYELLKKRAERMVADAPPQQRQPAARRSDTLLEATAKSVLRSAGSTLAREITRGVLGTLFGGRRR